MHLVPRLALFTAGAIASASAPAAMKLGVNTHFDQGWSTDLLSEVADAHAQGIRDTISWGKVEKAPGSYNLTAANSGYASLACQQGIPLLLMLNPRNKIYDEGGTVYSPEGRRAFAAYVTMLADRFPCIAAVEIGNEINGHSLKGKMIAQMPGSYVAILKHVRDALKPGHPQIALLAGSTQSIATGFLERLFEEGMLPLVDGIVVHPYRNVPEQIPVELDRLKAAMLRNGGLKPIWASEFGLYYPTPEAAPPHALKTMTLLSAARIARADWYALIDEKFYPNMGLFAQRTPKPALDTFRLVAQRLLPAGDAVRIDAGDPLTFIYRFGQGPYVMWGNGRSIAFDGRAVATDARGAAIATPTALGEDPVVVEANGYTLGAPTVLADTQIDFGQRWSYAVVNAAGKATPLAWIDWKWTSYVGAQTTDNFRALANAVSIAGAQPKPPMLVERYTAPVAGHVRVLACFEPAGATATAVRITYKARDLFAARIDGPTQPAPVDVDLAAGDSIDIGYSSLAPGGANVLRRRVRIVPQGSPAQAACPPAARDTE